MPLSSSIKDGSKQLALVFTGLLVFSLLFLFTYLYQDYHYYKNNYKLKQDSEVTELHQQIRTIEDNVVKFLKMTSKRLKKAEGDPRRIQNILSSSDKIARQLTLPSFQKVSYTQLSPKPLIITRFGEATLNHEAFTVLKKEEHGVAVTLKDGFLIGKASCQDEKGNLLGVLEVQSDLQDIRGCIKNFITISFSKPEKEAFHLSAEQPLAIYAITPLSFWQYVNQQLSHYLVFCVYLFCVFIIVVASLIYLYRVLKARYQQKISSLQDKLRDVEQSHETLKINLQNIEQELNTHLVSFQAYKNFFSDLHKHQKQQVAIIARSLDFLEECYKSPNQQISEFECHNLIYSNRLSAQSLAQGGMMPLDSQPICIERIIENVQSFFVERTLKMGLTVEVNCSDGLEIVADRIFIEFVLLNILGKAFHRVSKGGKICLNVYEEEEAILVEVIDKGFVLSVSAEKLINKSCDLFVPEDFLQHLCQESGMSYQTKKLDNETLLTKLAFQTTQTVSGHNVVQLFK